MGLYLDFTVHMTVDEVQLQPYGYQVNGVVHMKEGVCVTCPTLVWSHVFNHHCFVDK